MSKNKKLFLLFINVFFISMTASSGFAIIAVMKKVFVEKYKWFTSEEMMDYIALAQSCPGAMGINAAFTVGYYSCGISGVICAVLGCALPPIICMVLVFYFYNAIVNNQYVALFMSGMQIGVCAMLIDVTIGLFTTFNKKHEWLKYLLVLIFFLAIRYLHLSIVYMALFCIVLGFVKMLLFAKKMEVM